MEDRERQLEKALRAFMKLDWQPDSAPGPSYYMVYPVHEARKAMQEAGKLLDGQSPFPSDNDGSLFIYEDSGGIKRRSVWLGGMAYGEDQAALVPEKYREIFHKALADAR